MRKFIYMATAVLALAACSNETEQGLRGDDVPIRLRSSLTSAVQTRAGIDVQSSALQVVKDMAVGIYIEDVDGTSTYGSGYNEQKSNLAFIADGDGGLEGGAHYYPADGQKVNIYAYAPRQEGWNLTGTNSFEVQTNQTDSAHYVASDLMSGTHMDVSRSYDAVEIPMDHELAKVTVHLVEGDGIDLDQVNAVYIMNIITEGTVTMQDGIVGSVATADGATPTTIHCGTSRQSCSAVVIPQTVTASPDEPVTFIRVTTLDGGTFDYPLTADTQLEAGKEYIYTLTLTAFQLTVTSRVTPWGRGNGETGETKIIKHI